MKIGLLSDTHITGDAEELDPEVAKAFEGVELILHAGDVYVPSVLDQLEAIAPVLCARGNGDRDLAQDPRVKEAHVLWVEGMAIGLIHGLDYPEPEWRPLERAVEREFGRWVDVIVFGDTHVAVVNRCKGILLVNPGSLIFPNGLPDLPGTLGILEVAGARAEARIIQLPG